MRMSRGGELEWTPEANGKYEVKLVAIDTGIPQQRSEQDLTIEVVDPPEPEKPAPKLDIALQAEVSAFVTREGVPEAWIRSKLEGKTVYLKVGDELSLGSVQGKVVAVGANYMELETSGKRWTVGLDESLADAFRRLSID
jgi:hypothetical protein